MKLQEVRDHAKSEQLVVDQANTALESKKAKVAARDERDRKKKMASTQLPQDTEIQEDEDMGDPDPLIAAFTQ